MEGTPLKRARRAAGGKNVDLARLLGITESAVSQWKTVPPGRAIEIEEKTGGRVTRYELRPDYFGQPPSKRTRRAA
jgi:DNA-binding transcriptional regulator YdaS (Cro superfamily)